MFLSTLLLTTLVLVSGNDRFLRKDDDKPKEPKYRISARAGKFLGQDFYGVRAWRGIRYGTAQRWTDSIPAARLRATQEQFELGASCWQTFLCPRIACF